MDKVALGQVFLQVLRLCPVFVIPPLLSINHFLYINLLRNTNEETWELLNITMPLNKNPTNEVYKITPLSSHCYTPTYFSPQRTIIREYRYI